MVGITVQCRLGNQLFQYSFIKALSERLNTNFFLNDSLEEFYISEYFHLKDYNKLSNAFSKLIFKLKSGKVFDKLQNLDFSDFEDPVAVLQNLGNDKSYGGYFQSPLYFHNILPNLGSYIKIRKKYVEQFRLKYGEFFKTNRVIVVHIRRTDYLNLGNWWEENLGSTNLSLPDSYFSDCLEHIENLNDYKIVFISDDINYVKATFHNIGNAFFEENSAIIDFQLLMNADIAIISNSSFAWWAAFLNSKPNKVVYCPKYWLGYKIKKEYPNNIIPSFWTQVEI